MLRLYSYFAEVHASYTIEEQLLCSVLTLAQAQLSLQARNTALHFGAISSPHPALAWRHILSTTATKMFECDGAQGTYLA